MDELVDQLASMLTKTEAVMADITPAEHALPTPCPDYSVLDLLEHLAVWIQVFDSAVNDRPLAFDPSNHVVGTDHGAVFAAAGAGIVDGLRRHGVDRQMTMIQNPMPGEFILHMVLMEYVAHGWDLCRARDRTVPYDAVEAQTALASAQAIVQPQYRGSGMFDEIIPTTDDAPAIDVFVAFTGRRPTWEAPST